MDSETLPAAVDDLPHWKPILSALGPEAAAEFIWIATTDTIETYEHGQTMRYVHIDSLTGEFLNQQSEVISKESALLHARRPAIALKGEYVQPTLKAGGKAAQVDAPVQEPVLRAFTRRLGSEIDAPLWKRFGMQPSALLHPRVVDDAKEQVSTSETPVREAFSSVSHVETAVPESGREPSSQEPAFAIFTRRTAEI